MADTTEDDKISTIAGFSEQTAENHSYFTDGQLSCVGQDIEQIPQSLIDDYCKVTQRLDLSYNRLFSLQGLEDFENLQELILDNNELTDDMNIPPLKQLHTVTLNKNKINNLDALLDKLQNNLPDLRYLSLLGNTACPNQLSSSEKDDDDYRRYRYYVIYRLSKLKFLDSSPIKKSEVEEALRVGPYMKTIKVNENQIVCPSSESSSSSGSFTPLPSTSRDGDHKGTYGKSKYIYYGRHSEGNRFIRNNDL
ncbi:hypothetical protein SNE40_005888 [Patella caerulea]|uniref:Leucine-rich melanocyte differentiation-associated protein n=1 Tax=Patella caerulea TaxID=87958 RepID=A0AAN8K7G4_PATCE